MVESDRKPELAQHASRSVVAIQWGVGLLVAAISTWLLVDRLNWSGVRNVLRAADYRWVTAGGTAIIITLFARCRRWQALLDRSGFLDRTVLTALLVGQVVNLIAPARSGDLIRALWVVPERETHVAEVVGTVAAEKLWDLLAFLACTLALLFLLPLPAWLVRAAWAAALALAVAGGVVWGVLSRLTFAPGHPSRNPGRLLRVWLHHLAAGLDSTRRPRVARQVLFWTGLTWACGGLANFLVLAAFGYPQPVAALFLLVALMAGGMVPVPGRLGIFEGITVVSLAPFNVPPDEALAVGLVLHLVVMGPPLLAATLLLLWPPAVRRKS